MEPIISPWIIYLIGIAYPLSKTFLAASIFLGIATLIWTIAYIGYSVDKEEGALNVLTHFEWVKWVFMITLLVALLIPSRSTLIGMLIAKNITPNTVKEAVATGKDFKNEIKTDILDIIQSLQNPPTNKREEGK